MALWLVKEEPTHYAFADLVRDGGTIWEGVKNPQAARNLGDMRPGDRVLYYHTGKEKAVVGEARVAAHADGVVRLEAVRPLPVPVTLARIKAEPALAGWALVRQPQLSVMPVTEVEWRLVEAMASEG
jgi:predicted RNA-binding protein with PUA-like domain